MAQRPSASPCCTSSSAQFSAAAAEIGVVVEHAAQVDGIVGAVAFHHGGGLHQRDDRRIQPGGVEAVPRDIGDLPVFHGG